MPSVESESANNPFPSLCIPRVNINITQSFIISIFTSLAIGNIKRINMVFDKDKKYKTVFIYIQWNDSPSSNGIRARLNTYGCFKLMYCEQWFWKVRVNQYSSYRNTHSNPTPHTLSQIHISSI